MNNIKFANLNTGFSDWLEILQLKNGHWNRIHVLYHINKNINLTVNESNFNLTIIIKQKKFNKYDNIFFQS